MIESSTKSSNIDYVIQIDDTLFGLELKFNLSKSIILDMNGISQEGYLYPGMVYKN